MLRKLALAIPLSLLMLLSFTADGFAQRSMKSIRDFSYLHREPRTKAQRIEDFVEGIRSGSRLEFKYVTYDVLEGAIVKLKREADQYRTTRTLRENRMIKYLLDTTASDQERAFQTLVRAILPGIFNMDPRVRLVATDWLRGLRPDAAMQRAVKLAIGVDIEVIRYDHRKGQFVFKHPRILETVASGYEYYREKDIDWPTSFQTGADGPNNDTKKLFGEAPQLRDGTAPENTTTGLNARRWGDQGPRYHPDKGYGQLSAEELTKLQDYYQKALEEAEAEAQKKYGGDVTYLPLNRYRKYPKEGAQDEEGKRKDAQLLFEQFYQMGEKVPVGQGRRYIYLNRECQLVLATPWAELTKLDEYVTRTVWWEKIRKGNKQVMTFLSKDTFSTLFRSIDGELPERIPMLSFATSRPMINPNETAKVVDVFINGLHKNKVLSSKYVILRALKDIYVDRYGKLETTDAIREKINIALWEFKREANRLDLQAGREVVAESITVGKRPADDWVPIKPVGVGRRTQLDFVDYGFKRPNDEILGASFRLISDAGSSAGGASEEAKDCIDDLFNARFYSFRRGDNTFVTWYGSQAEWKAQYDQLTKGAACFDMKAANPELVKSDWIFNYDQMKKAQSMVDAILTGDPDVLRTATWFDVESAIILTIKRVQLKYANAGAAAGTIVTTFFDQLRKQEVIVDVPEAKTDKNLRSKKFADELGAATGDKYKNNSYSDEKREAIKQAALGGLFNKDPRIRLTAIHFLRRLGPDESMLEQVTTARSIMSNVESEKALPETSDNLHRFIDTNVYKRIEEGDLTVTAGGAAPAVACADTTQGLYVRKCWNRYEGVVADKDLKDKDKDQVRIILNPAYKLEDYEWKHTYSSKRESKEIPFFGFYQLKSPGEELEKLYKFIMRKRLVAAIKRGDVNAITKLSKSDFDILGQFIDDEYQIYVPFGSFHSTSLVEAEVKPSRYAIFGADDVKVIKRGIDNSNFLIQKGTAEFLIRFYNFYTGYKATDAVKKEIRDAMYFYKQDDVVVEEFVLAFEGENPDGRSVILAGTKLSQEMNPGGERVYQTLPVGILMDIRNAVLGEYEELPESLKGILGILGARANKASASLEYGSTAAGTTVPVREAPTSPSGDGNRTVDGTGAAAPAGTAAPAPAADSTAPAPAAPAGP